MNNLKFRYVYQHKEDFKIADTRDSIWTLEQIAEGEPNNYIDVCLSSSWKVININQYTGLKDKNGKEIFDGDVVKFQKDIFEIKMNNYGRFSGFCLNNTRYNNIHGVYMFDFIGVNNTNLEIIGNIYENPELINS